MAGRRGIITIAIIAAMGFPPQPTGARHRRTDLFDNMVEQLVL